jgi:hypothetical protein
MRSLSVKSRRDLSSGLRVINQMLDATIADTALAPIPLRVRSQISADDGTPWPEKCTAPARNESTIAEGPASLLQVTAVAAKPLAARCFSTSFWPCMTISGK